MGVVYSEHTPDILEDIKVKKLYVRILCDFDVGVSLSVLTTRCRNKCIESDLMNISKYFFGIRPTLHLLNLNKSKPSYVQFIKTKTS